MAGTHVSGQVASRCCLPHWRDREQRGRRLRAATIPLVRRAALRSPRGDAARGAVRRATESGRRLRAATISPNCSRDRASSHIEEDTAKQSRDGAPSHIQDNPSRCGDFRKERSVTTQALPVRDVWVARCDREQVFPDSAYRVAAPDLFFTHPVLSPDGKTVAFWGGEGNTVDLWTADLARNRARKLGNGTGVSGHPAWSPDSKAIACFHNPEKRNVAYFPPWGSNEAAYSPRDIWTIDVETGEWQQVTDDGFDNERPAWSPDGEKICYVSGHGGTKELWVADLVGGNTRQLTEERRILYRPAWHPDGTRIACNNKGAANHDLWIVDLCGGDARKLLASGGGPGTYHDHGAFWSSDGRDLIFHSDRDGQWGIWIVDSGGMNLRRVELPGCPNASHPSWDREESLIAFDRPRV